MTNKFRTIYWLLFSLPYPFPVANACRSMPTISSVTHLSDDEPECQGRPRPVKRRRVSRGFRPKWETMPARSHQAIVRSIVVKKCGCSCDCFKPFRNNSELFDQVVEKRKSLAHMSKLEQDEHVSLLEKHIQIGRAHV